MSTDFIGRGWSFPTRITPTGAVRLVGGSDDIDAALRMILTTSPGERVMRPDFGCALWDQVYAPMTPSTLGLIEHAVREAVERWEPRVVLDRVEAVADPAAGAVHVHLDYRVATTNDRRNLVHPFYVIPREEAAP
ncbi:GPW/gp25 family protein [Thalassiella azotivora]